MKGPKSSFAVKKTDLRVRVFAILIALALAACGISLVSGFTSESVASADDQLSQLSSTKVDVSIKQTGDQLGEASLDKDVYYVGDTAVLTWKGMQVGNNLVIPQSIRYNDITIPLGTLTRVDAVQTENTEYERRMGESATMTTFDSLKDYVTQEHQVVLPYITVDTVVTVDFVRVAPVYRMYNMITSEHMFSTNKVEYDNWVEIGKTDGDFWIGEGIDWLSPTTDTGSQTVHRLYNAGLGAEGKSSHYYTESEEEMQNLMTTWGWTDDGIDNQYKSGGNLPVYTCYNESLKSAHHYTSNKSEWENLRNYAWNLERDKNGTSGVFHAVGDVRWYTASGYYIVYHEQENLDGTYSTVEAQTLQGEAGTNTAAVAKTYAGFTAGAVPIATIEADNSTRISIKYTRNIYKVQFDTGGYGQKLSTMYYKYGEKIVVPSNVNANGYEFKGWYLDKEFKTPFNPDTAMPAGDLTIYAKWAPATYKIAYELDGGENDPSNPTEYTFEQGVSEFKDAVKEGYTFEGWYKSPYFTESSKVSSLSATEYGDITLYAKFKSPEIASYTVIHKYQKTDGNFPESAEDGAVIEIGKGYVGDVTTAEVRPRDGFTVRSTWHQEQIKENDETIVYIEYTRRSYTLKFDYNGHGIGEAPAAQQVLYGATITTPTTPVDSKYQFAGWYLDAEGSEHWGHNGDGAKAMPNHDLTLYAKWTSSQVFTLTFDTQGGTPITAEEVIEGEAVEEPAAGATTKEGYTLHGWFTDTTYMTGFDFSVPIKQNTTVYAKWEPKDDTTYTVRHIKQNADGTWDNATVVEQTMTGRTDAKTTAVAKTSASDSDFVGFTAQTFEQADIKGDGTTVVEIKYDRTTHKVSFDNKLHGSAIADYTDVRFGDTIGAPSPAPSEAGWSFEGWFKDFDTTQKWNFSGDTIPDYDITLYAKWSPMTFKIDYVLNGGVNDASNPTSYVYATGAGALRDATKDGYQFDGWYTDENFADGTKVTSIDQTDIGNKTLYAKWTALTYKITYNLNGGVNSSENPEKYTYGEGVEALKDPTQTDKVFAGWFTSADFAHGTQKTSISKNATGNITLYAKWDEWPTATYKVKHVYQNADGTWPTEEGKGVVTVTSSGKVDHQTDAHELSQTGFKAQTFSNVNITKDGKAEVEIKYNRNQHTLKFNYNGHGTETEKGEAVYFGATITTPENPTDEKYNFAGWYKDANGTERWGVGDSTMPDADMTLYAKWSDKDVLRVRFETNGGTYLNTAEVVEGEILEEPEENATTKDGYTFVEWDSDKTLTQKADFTQPVMESKTVYANWSVNPDTKYTVRHMKQNTDGSWDDAVYYDEVKYGQTDTQTVAQALTTADYTGFTAETIKQKNIDGDGTTIVIVKYDRSKYTVSFDNLGHGSKPSDQNNLLFGATVKEPSELQADGYVFGGWYKDNKFAEKWNFDTDTVPNNNLTLYAKWENAKYTIDYELNGGTNSTANPNEYTFGTGVSKLEPATMTGFDFAGWYTDSSLSEVTKVEQIATNKTGNVKLYAKFTAASYKINYVLKDGETNPSSNPTSYVYGNGVASFADAEKANHYFNGWYTTDTFEADSLVTKIDKDKTGEITLYAQFTEIPNVTYKVHDHFMKTDGNYAYAGEDGFTEYTKTGRVGTMTTAEAKTDITGFTVKEVKNVVIEKDKEILVDIFYDRNQHLMTFDYNDHGTGAARESSYVYYGAEITLPAEPSDNVYNFAGWHTDRAGNEHWGHAGVAATPMPDNDFILYAKWTSKNVWKVTYDTDGGSTIKTEEVIDGNKAPEPAAGKTEKDGYTLDGWYTDKTYKTKFNFDQAITENKTVYAKWNANTTTPYEVHHIKQSSDGSWNKSVYETEAKTGTTGQLTNAEKKTTTDYVGFTAQTITQQTINANGKTVVEVLYERTKHTVNFNVQGHGDTPTALTNQLYGATIEAPSPAPSEAGYSFEGWYTDDKCTSAWTFKTDTVPNKDITLYAKWRERNYNITYVLFDGTNSADNPDSYTYKTGVAELKAPTKDGNLFQGWYTSPMFEDSTRVTSISNTELGDKILYAKWGLSSYTINYQMDGGKNDVTNPTSYIFGVGVKSFADPEKDGYTFDGWYTDKDFKNKIVLVSDTQSGDLILFAKWTEKEETYWIAPSSTITTSNATPVTNPNYKSETTGKVKSQAQIEKDVKVLQDVSHSTYSKEEYNEVKATYENYMITDEYHLYTYYGTGNGTSKNDFVEFRIVQVGSHEAKGDKTDGSKYSDHTVLTFQATHALPTAYQTNSENSNNGGWNNMTLKNTLNNGAIFQSFRKGFTDQVSSVVKWNRVGNDNKTVSNKMVSSSEKFWLMSYSEYVPTIYTTWASTTINCEGDQYAFWKTGKTINEYAANAALVPLAKTRANTYPTGATNNGIWKTRTVWPNKANYSWINGNTNGAINVEKYTNVAHAVVPCFSFGATATNTVTYKSNGGTDVSTQYVHEGSLVTEPTTPTKTDYVFAGWYKNEDFSGEAFDFSKEVITEDITLYAKWAPSFYTVKFDANDNADNITGKMDDQKRNVGDGQQLTANAFKKFDTSGKQYGFKEWNTQRDGNGKSFTDLTDQDIMTIGGDSIVLYAQWTEKTLEEYGYWLAPASKTITSTTAGVANKYYSMPESGIIKTKEEIQKDVAVIKAGRSDTNPTYDAVVDEYKAYMNNDNYHLYTKLKTTQTVADNQYVEFRIVEVGSHYSIALGDEEGRRHSDKTALTFQATHSLVNATKISSDGTNKGGWSGSSLRKSMNEGEIYQDFNETFTSDVSRIVKWGRQGNKNGVLDNSVINSADKFWIMSYSEYVSDMTAAYKTANVNREGDQYAFWSGKVPNYNSVNNSLTGIGKTRAGANNNGASYTGYTWQRTTYPTEVNKYNVLRGNGNPVDWTQTDQLSGVNICFAFGGPEAVYDVTFESNGGNDVVSQGVNSGDLAYQPTDPTRTDFKFGGWYTDEKCEGEAFDFKTTKITQNTKLYAKWIPLTYTVHFEGNGNTSGTMSDQRRELDDNLQLSANQFERNVEGKTYGFKSWNTKPNGDGTTVTDRTLGNLTEKMGETITLYAQWTTEELEPYWIAASSKTTTGSTAALSDVENKYYTRPETSVVRTASEIRADVEILKKGESDPAYAETYKRYQEYMTSDAYHLYTKLEKEQTDPVNQYVEFRIINIGAHEAQGAMSTGGKYSDGSALTFQATHTLPTAYQMNKSTPVQGGWKNTSLRTLMNQDDIFDNFRKGFTDDVTGVVKWTRKGWNNNKVSNDMISTNDKFWVISYSEYVPSVYKDWVDLKAGNEGDQYQYWAGKITNNNGNNAALTGLNKTRNGGSVGSAAPWMRTMYPTNSYYMTTYGTSTVHSNYATYAFAVAPCFTFGGPENIYTVKFDSQDGSAVDDQEVKANDVATKPENPTRTDFKFDGWYKNAECTGDEVDFTTEKITANTTLYAKWIPLTYHVQFNGNGATEGKMENQRKEIGDELQLTKNAFRNVKDNKTYGFVGWNTKEDGTGDWYYDRTEVDLSDENGVTIQLYAQWTKQEIGTYWIAASKKVTTATSYDVDNKYYTNPETSVKKTESEIKEDVAILQKGDVAENTKYKVTYEEYEKYMNSDEYHLYTMLNEKQTLEDDQYVEFRILEVGPHQSTGNKTNTDKFSDETALTFQATHTLPTGAAMSTANNSKGGWRSSDMRTNLNTGKIFSNFSKDFTDQVTEIVKWSREGYSQTGYMSNTLLSTKDKFWLASYSELVPTMTDAFKSADADDEGNQYTFWKNRIKSGTGKQGALSGLQYTRAGNNTTSSGQYTRSIYPENGYRYYYVLLYQTDVLNYSTYSSSIYGVVPCFSFGGPTSINEVTYDSQEGTSVHNQYVDNGDYVAKPADPTRVDFQFDGWYTQPDGEGDKWDFDNMKVTEDKTLYAKWIPLTYHVAFDGNGSTEGEMSEQRKVIGDKLQLTKNAFTNVKDNKTYGFVGWNTEKDGSGKWYYDRTEVDLSDKNGVTIQLYAQWTKEEIGTYWIAASKKVTTETSYNVDNKYYTNPESSVVKTESEIKKDVEILKKGKVDGNPDYQATYDKYVEYMNSDAYHLYTKLKTKQTLDDDNYVEFRILEVGPHYATGNKTNTDKFSDETALTFQATHTLPKGYAMSTTNNSKGGWRSSDMRTNLNSGEIFSEFSKDFTDQITETVKWSREGYSQTGYMSNTLLSTNDKFWLASYSEYVPTMTDEFKTVDADDEGNQYTFWKNRIKSGTGKQGALTGLQYTRAGNNTTSSGQYTRSIYPENGYRYYYVLLYQTGVLNYSTYSSSHYGVVPCFSFGGPTTIDEVTYDSQEGTSVHSQYVDDGDYAAKPADPTRTDFEFAGWYTEKDGQGTKWNFDTMKITKNTTLYANWTPLTYHVAFNGNGSTDGEMSEQRKEIGDKLQLTKNAYRKVVDNKTYGFVGWNTQEDGEGDWYDDRTEVDLSTENGVTIQLYAQWTTDEIGTYWIAASKKVTTDTSYYQDNKYYTNPETSVVRTEADIKKDVEIIKEGSSNSAYADTVKRYTEYMNSDAYHLYTKLQKKQTLEDDQYVEFRIIEVGPHLSTGNKTDTGKFSDESALTFQATHTLPTGYAMSTTNSAVGGWGSSDMYTNLNSGDIFKDFSEDFTSQVSEIVKWSREGYTKNGNMSNTLLSTKNKFWLASYSELVSNMTDEFKSADADDEGDQYTYWKNKITNGTGKKGALTGLQYTRAGNNTTSSGQYTRSIYPENGYRYYYVLLYQTGVLNYSTYSSSHYGVVPCFSFGGPTSINKVTYDSQEGSSVSAQYINNGDYVAKPADPTRTDFEFAGWYTAENGGGEQWNFNTKTVTEDVTLYAKWNPLTYHVAFNGNGSTDGTMKEQRREKGDTLQLSANAFKKVENGKVYGFTGWNTQPNGGGESYSNRQLGDIKAELGETVTLYAQWTTSELGAYWIGASYKITNSTSTNAVNKYYTNPETTVVKTASEIKEDVKILQKGDVEGNDKYQATYDQYKEYMDSDAYHLYTKLESTQSDPINQYVEFRIINVGPHNAQGKLPSGGKYSDGTALTFQMTHTLTKAYAMNTTNSCVGGWGSTSLREQANKGDIYKDFNADFTSDVAEIVKWQRKGNSGNAISNDMVSTRDKFWPIAYSEYVATVRDSYTNKNVECEGEQYQYWNGKITNNAGKNSALTGLNYMRNGSQVGSGATWMRSVDPDNQYYYIDNYQYSLTHEAYPYYGYSVALCFSFGAPENIYEVKFDTQGGTSIDSQDIVGGEVASRPENPTKTYYDFAGWYTTPECTGEKVDFTNVKIETNTTFYAKWVPLTYEIHFDGNESTTGKMNDQRRTKGDNLTLTANAYQKAISEKTYGFKGWNTKKDGTGTTYSDKYQGDIAEAELGKTITLYAQWTTDELGAYWIAASAKVTSSATSCGITNATYNNPESSVVKTAKQIKEDVAVLQDSNNAKYDETKKEYEGYMNSDAYHLYTKLVNQQTESVNQYVEFRIIQVGQHASQGPKIAGARYNDGTSLTFQATHTLPKAYQMHTSSTVQGGWGNTSLRTSMNSGDIFKDFNADFTKDVAEIVKWQRKGSQNSKVCNDMVATKDKFWLASYSELSPSISSDYANKNMEAEGDQYDYWHNKVTRNNNTNAALNTITYTRSGSQLSSGCAWMRSVNPNTWQYFLDNYQGGLTHTYYPNSSYPVVPCFSFGGPTNIYTVSFDAGNGTTVNDQLINTGDIATQPDVTKTGYELEGWYTGANGTGTKWDFTNSKVTADTKLYANWKEKTAAVASLSSITDSKVTDNSSTPKVESKEEDVVADVKDVKEKSATKEQEKTS